MGKLTTKLKNGILDNCFGHQVTPTANTLYLALSTTPIQPDGTGLTEPTIGVGAYARVSIANTNLAQWTTASNGVKSNTNQLTFPTATTDWGEFAYWAMLNSSTGVASTNVEAYGELNDSAGVPTPVDVANTDQLVIPIGALVIEAD